MLSFLVTFDPLLSHTHSHLEYMEDSAQCFSGSFEVLQTNVGFDRCQALNDQPASFHEGLGVKMVWSAAGWLGTGTGQNKS